MSNASADLERWRRAGSVLEEVRHRELQALNDREALTATRQLLDLLRFAPPKTTGSGLLEQQRLFARGRG